MDEELKRRLLEAAQRRARDQNFPLGFYVIDDLGRLIDQGVNRMNADELLDENKRQLAENNLIRLIDEMVVEGNKRNLLERLDTRTFSDARMRICPLWPFC